MNWWIIVIIVVILGFIFGNILLLKQSANFKFEKKPKQDEEEKHDKSDNGKNS